MSLLSKGVAFSFAPLLSMKPTILTKPAIHKCICLVNIWNITEKAKCPFDNPSLHHPFSQSPKWILLLFFVFPLDLSLYISYVHMYVLMEDVKILNKFTCNLLYRSSFNFLFSFSFFHFSHIFWQSLLLLDIALCLLFLFPKLLPGIS